MQDFEERDIFDEKIKKDDEFLLIFVIIYSFERMGFDSKLDKCNKHCKLYKENGKIKTHPLSVLIALNEIKKEYGVKDVKELLEIEKSGNLVDRWFKKTKEIHNYKFKRGFR
ncbi:MAG TPA: hypothetical protein ENI52_00135 [Thermoplasmata archaeon]|nr:hypothetical protein [Thermoplasmata archaeon]